MIYKVAKYIRLSEQDGDKKESESVENQRDLIDNYIQKHNDLEEYDEYVDDGYTGGNFDRPKFKKMIQDIEDGKIDCIITKDLSRFGRDHIDTGYYLERYLPKKNIRYIAIGDGIDTVDSKGLQFLSFKLSFNDYYIQDISNKIKSVKKKKMNKGEYQAGIAPYGYKKDENIKNHLVIDENVYMIVQEIFKMYANGMSTIKIAYELNKRKITSPSVYMDMACSRRKCTNPNGEFCWLRTQIGSMLKNQTYLGYVVSGKREQVSPKLKKGVQKKKEEYIIVKGMHEPIINQELWNKVQNRLSSYHTNTTKKYNYILKGLVFCGECGSEATFQHNKSKNKTGKIYWEGNYAICKKRNNYVMLCENKILGEHIILKAIKDVIKKELERIDYTSKELKGIYEKSKLKAKNNERNLDNQITNIENEINHIVNKFTELYKSKLANEISADEFNCQYEEITKKRKLLNKEKEELEKQKESLKTNDKKEQKEFKEIKKVAQKFLSMENPDRETITRLVKRIEFDKNKNIKIELTFSNPYENEKRVLETSGKQYATYPKQK